MVEERAGVPHEQRSFLLLQPRLADGILLLPGEESGCDEVRPIAEHFQQRGFVAFASSLSMRALNQPGQSPRYWQTCADEATNRFDILQNCAERIVVLGVGLAGTIALHLATARRPSAVLALFPALHSGVGWQERLRQILGRLAPRRRARSRPGDWPQQRRLAAAGAREVLGRIGVPLFVLAEDRQDRSEAGHSAQVARHLIGRKSTEVRLLRPGEVASVHALPAALLDDMLAFARGRSVSH